MAVGYPVGHARDTESPAATNQRTFQLLGAHHQAKEVLVPLLDGNLEFIEALVHAVESINDKSGQIDAPPLTVRLLHDAAVGDIQELRRRILSPVLDDTFVSPREFTFALPQWLRDVGLLGVLDGGRERDRRLAVVPMWNGGREFGRRGVATTTSSGLLAQVCEATPLSDASLSFNALGNKAGNVLPTAEDVLLIGNTTDATLRQMFRSLGYGDRIALLDTSWLAVGHVDEIISTVPTSIDPSGYVVAVADPVLALRMVRDASQSSLDEIENRSYGETLSELRRYLVVEGHQRGVRAGDSAERSGADGVRRMITRYLAYSETGEIGTSDRRRLLEQIVAAHRGLEGGVRRVPLDFIVSNLLAADRIATSEETLIAVTHAVRSAGGSQIRAPVKVVSYPQLYVGERDLVGEVCKMRAYHPNVVNQDVFGPFTIAPDPQIRMFRTRIRQDMANVGIETGFVRDDFYHERGGNIHCATNERRIPNRFER